MHSLLQGTYIYIAINSKQRVYYRKFKFISFSYPNYPVGYPKRSESGVTALFS